jgi:hypothetical protein
MQQIPKRVKRMIREHAGRAWETEMRAALGQLAERFDAWRADALSTDELDQAVHHYHNGTAREIWKRYQQGDPLWALAIAVARGVIDLDSLPPEVLAQVEPLITLFSRAKHPDEE